MRSSARRDADDREQLAAGRVVDLGDVLGQAVGVEERGHRNRFLGFLIDHQRHADAAVGMAAAAELAPVAVRSVDQVGPIGEGAHEGDREPVARGLAQSGLVLHVVRQVGQRVALRLAALVGDGLVAAGEAKPAGS